MPVPVGGSLEGQAQTGGGTNREAGGVARTTHHSTIPFCPRKRTIQPSMSYKFPRPHLPVDMAPVGEFP